MLPDVEIVEGREGRFLCFRTHDFISDHIRSHGVWGEIESGLATLMCEGVTAPLILDVGANLGAFSIPVAKKLGPAGAVVHAFEPQRIVFQQLCGNIFLNRLDNVFTHQLALGSETKTIRLPKVDYHNTLNIGSVSLIPGIQKVTRVAYSETEAEDVRMTTIDAMALPGRCAFIKLDVEGFESEVIAGARAFLEANGFPPILFEEWRKGKFTGAVGEEIEQRQAQTRGALGKLGYEFIHINTDVIAQHPGALAKVALRKQDDQTFKIVRER